MPRVNAIAVSYKAPEQFPLPREALMMLRSLINNAYQLPTPQYVPIVARAPQQSPVPSIPPITLSPEGSSGYFP
ncbi:hypothetical protein E4U17_000878 [Claviceps sp. LM77 group G4]|nr:hypothetical protein E4U17_000878 [Claviceps sp. LM77 group G4]